MQVGTKKWCQCVTRDGPAASKRPASEIIRTRRNSVACTYNGACACALCVNTYTTTPLFTVILAPIRKSSDAGSASKPNRSRDVLSISEKLKILDMIEIGKKKKSNVEIARLYGKNESSIR